MLVGFLTFSRFLTFEVFGPQIILGTLVPPPWEGSGNYSFRAFFLVLTSFKEGLPFKFSFGGYCDFLVSKPFRKGFGFNWVPGFSEFVFRPFRAWCFPRRPLVP